MTESSANMLPMVAAIARRAGDAIMKIYEDGEIGATSKADQSPLTLADMASHHVIVAGLRECAPDIPLLSEEAADIEYEERRQWPVYWLVDPLDGTKEFIKRNGEFTVNIALIKNCKPVLGVVYAPVLQTCYCAAEGVGAHVQRNGDTARPIMVESCVHGKPIKVVASRSHSDERTTTLLAGIGDHETISMGSSLKFCLVAEGKANCYPRLGPTMEWDTAAAHAVVNEAGGIVCESNGHELRYNKPDMHNPEFFVIPKGDRALRELLNIESPSSASESGLRANL